MNAIVEAFAFFLGFLGWLMVGVALPNRYWKVSSVDGNVITTSTIYENLWMSCATDSTGVHNCRDFPSLLALNGIVVAEVVFCRLSPLIMSIEPVRGVCVLGGSGSVPMKPGLLSVSF
uniref:Claudin n=1 Tax=Dicentrarchus labrax TaxID=13489 RepID=A0A8P4GJF3_DICLA